MRAAFLSLSYTRLSGAGSSRRPAGDLFSVFHTLQTLFAARRKRLNSPFIAWPVQKTAAYRLGKKNVGGENQRKEEKKEGKKEGKKKRRKRRMEATLSIQDLPVELVSHIVEYLSSVDKMTAEWVCVMWRRIVARSFASVGLADRAGRLVGNNYMYRVAIDGHLGLVRWASGQGSPYCWIVSCVAAKRGDVETLACVRAHHDTFWYHRACRKASKAGHLHVLQWYADRDRDPSPSCAHAAARGGHIHVLVWLVERGCKLSAPMMDAAASRGHLHVVQWLHERGCPWHNCRTAVRNGRLDMVVWMRQHGCRWGKGTLKAAARYGRRDIIEWASRNDPPH